MKKILAICFSQSGQLNEILDNFLAPLDADVDRVHVKMKESFPFPWTAKSFYDVLPESVLEEAFELKTLSFKYEQYDLVVFGHQPWFLSPSIPTTSILKNEEVRKRIAGTPVITVIGSRNMWLGAQESVKREIKEAGGTLVGNIPLFDRSPNLASAVAIVHWMMTGKKTRKWGIFPLPGVSKEDIEFTSEYGKIVNEHHLKGKEYEKLQEEFLALGKIDINTNVMFVESRAKKLFTIWAKKIKQKGTTPEKRRRWLIGFRIYLNFALFIISPIVLLLFNLIIRPLTYKRIQQQKQYFCSVNLI